MKSYTLMQLKQTSTPEEFSRHLQEMGELFWWEPGQFWVVTSYRLAKSLLTNPDYSCDRSPFFISRMPKMDLSLITDFFSVVSKMMVMSDGQEHMSRRRVCYHGFTQRCLNQLTPLIHHTIEQCLIEFTPGSSFEFVSQLAQVIPSTTLAELFAIPENERLNFYDWSNNMTQFFGGSTTYLNADGMKVNHSAKQLHDYFAHLIKERRNHPKDDFLSQLLKHQSHFGLDDEEIISQAVMMLVAGQVTTTDQLCNNLFIVLNTPGLWQQMQSEPERIDEYLEEFNRLDPGVTFIFRVAKNDTKLGEQLIKKGSVMFISTHAVNRDPEFFLNPNQIDLNKRPHAHFSYGYGGHFCLGAKLARIEMRLILEALLKRYPNLTLDKVKPALRKHHSLSFSGFEQLYFKA